MALALKKGYAQNVCFHIYFLLNFNIQFNCHSSTRDNNLFLIVYAKHFSNLWFIKEKERKKSSFQNSTRVMLETFLRAKNEASRVNENITLLHFNRKIYICELILLDHRGLNSCVKYDNQFKTNCV